MYIRRILLAIVLIGLLAAGAFAYMVYNAFFTPNTAFNNDVAHIYIPSDATFEDVKEMVAPLLKDVSTFESVADRKKYNTNVKGGKYGIKKGMNNNSIINTLRSQNMPVKVSFNNQEMLPNLAGRISVQIEADSVDLLKAFNDTKFLQENKLNEDTKLAVYLPNSYEFFWNTGAEEFRDRMLKEYNSFWNDERNQKAKSKGLTPLQVISLASIVHKETAKVERASQGCWALFKPSKEEYASTG